jgi:hypothetical protein
MTNFCFGSICFRAIHFSSIWSVEFVCKAKQNKNWHFKLRKWFQHNSPFIVCKHFKKASRSIFKQIPKSFLMTIKLTVQLVLDKQNVRHALLFFKNSGISFKSYFLTKKCYFTLFWFVIVICYNKAF